MPPFDASELLNREFLEIRARLLQVAASLDRISRAEGTVENDPRLEKLGRALSILQTADSNRAEQIQLIFSRAYDQNWPESFGLRAAVKTKGTANHETVKHARHGRPDSANGSTG
jgi:hypothetical protein